MVVLVVSPRAGDRFGENARQPLDLVRNKSVLCAEPGEHLQLAEILRREPEALVNAGISHAGIKRCRVQDQRPAVLCQRLFQEAPVLERAALRVVVGAHLLSLGTAVRGRQFRRRLLLADARHLVVGTGEETRPEAPDRVRRISGLAVREGQRVPRNRVVTIRRHHVMQLGNGICVSGGLEVDAAEKNLCPIEPWLQREGDLGTLLSRCEISAGRIPGRRRQLHLRVGCMALQRELIVGSGAGEIPGLVVEHRE